MDDFGQPWKTSRARAQRIIFGGFTRADKRRGHICWWHALSWMRVKFNKLSRPAASSSRWKRLGKSVGHIRRVTSHNSIQSAGRPTVDRQTDHFYGLPRSPESRGESLSAPWSVSSGDPASVLHENHSSHVARTRYCCVQSLFCRVFLREVKKFQDTRESGYRARA